jgi:hypothetical protein
MIIKDDTMSNKDANKHQSDDDQQGQQGVAKMELQKRWEEKKKAMQIDTTNKQKNTMGLKGIKCF